MKVKFDTLRFALAGGILIAVGFAVITAATLLGIPGYAPFAKLLEEGYGFYGYSLSWFGVVTSAIWGFVEGFILLGFLALIYNKLVSK